MFDNESVFAHYIIIWQIASCIKFRREKWGELSKDTIVLNLKPRGCYQRLQVYT